MNVRSISTFDRRLGENFKFIRSVDVLLEVDFPLVFSFDADDNKNYLAYVLKFKRRKKILELLVVETNYQILLDLASQKISLKQALTINTQKYITDEGILEASPQDLLEQLPDDDFYLTELLPNRIDISEKKGIFAEKLRFYAEYYSKIQHSDELKKMKYPKFTHADYLKFYKHNSKKQGSDELKKIKFTNLYLEPMSKQTPLCKEQYVQSDVFWRSYLKTIEYTSESVGLEIKTNKMINPANTMIDSNWEKDLKVFNLKGENNEYYS
ncbi:hypothetical protein [Bacillus cereus]|uniref:hypothetical protein n=1 Tax=Bacillus cereus TaxID=1396 RepID=UPI000BF47193|nr:hypothetical protein [Bacillus cereus]PER97019.1 hypothetical protein CN500_11290 [Bacillus cereus]